MACTSCGLSREGYAGRLARLHGTLVDYMIQWL